jgi:hypothetical protein
MTENDSGSARHSRHDRARVSEPLLVGQQEKRRQWNARAARLPCPLMGMQGSQIEAARIIC